MHHFPEFFTCYRLFKTGISGTPPGNSLRYDGLWGYFNWQREASKKEKRKKSCLGSQSGAKVTSVHFKWQEMTQHGDEGLLFITEVGWVPAHLTWDSG